MKTCNKFSLPVWGDRQNPDPGFRHYSAGLLQLILRHSRCLGELSAVNWDCHGTSHHRTQVVRAHRASSMSAALATSPQTTGIQDIHPRLSFIGWYRSCVSSWWMYTGCRRWLTSFAFCWQSDMCGQEITQPVWWPLFCHCWTNAVEQSAWTSSATRHGQF